MADDWGIQEAADDWGIVEAEETSNLERMGERLATRSVQAGAGLLRAGADTKPAETIYDIGADIGEKAGLDAGKEPGYFDAMAVPGAAIRSVVDYAGSLATKGIFDIADLTAAKGDPFEEPVREWVRENQPLIQQEAKDILGDPNMQYQGGVGEKFGWDVAEATVNMVPMLAAGWATRNPGVTLGVMGMQVGGSTYADYLDKTGDHDKAMTAAKFHVAAEIVPETIPVMAILRKPVAGEGVSRMLEATIGEGAQEMLTSILQQTYDKTALENMTLKDAILNIDWSNAAYEGLIGVFVGGTLATPGAIADAITKPAETPTEFSPEPFEPVTEVKSLQENAGVIEQEIQALDELETTEESVVEEAEEIVEETPLDMPQEDVAWTPAETAVELEATETEAAQRAETQRAADLRAFMESPAYQQALEQSPDSAALAKRYEEGLAKLEKAAGITPTEVETAPPSKVGKPVAEEAAWGSETEVEPEPETTPKPEQPQTELPEDEPIAQAVERAERTGDYTPLMGRLQEVYDYKDTLALIDPETGKIIQPAEPVTTPDAAETVAAPESQPVESEPVITKEPGQELQPVTPETSETTLDAPRGTSKKRTLRDVQAERKAAKAAGELKEGQAVTIGRGDFKGREAKLDYIETDVDGDPIYWVKIEQPDGRVDEEAFFNPADLTPVAKRPVKPKKGPAEQEMERIITAPDTQTAEKDRVAHKLWQLEKGKIKANIVTMRQWLGVIGEPKSGKKADLQKRLDNWRKGYKEGVEYERLRKAYEKSEAEKKAAPKKKPETKPAHVSQVEWDYRGDKEITKAVKQVAQDLGKMDMKSLVQHRDNVIGSDRGAQGEVLGSRPAIIEAFQRRKAEEIEQKREEATAPKQLSLTEMAADLEQKTEAAEKKITTKPAKRKLRTSKDIAADERVSEVIDERSEDGIFDRNGNGYWVYLNEGWVNDEGETSIHEATIKDVLAELDKVVRREPEAPAPEFERALARSQMPYKGETMPVVPRIKEGKLPKYEGLDAIDLSAEFDGETITQNAAEWLEQIDDRIRSVMKLLDCV